MPTSGQKQNEQSSTNALLKQVFESRMKNEIDESDLLWILNDTDVSRSFDRHTKFTIDHCKLLIAAVAQSKKKATLSLAELTSVIDLLYTWRNFFRRHDLDRNGIIEPYALVNILNSLPISRPIDTILSYSESAKCFPSNAAKISQLSLKTKDLLAHSTENTSLILNMKEWYQLDVKWLNGFNLSPLTLETIVKRYATRVEGSLSPKISFEHYVQLCARLTLLTDLMQQKSNNDSPRNLCSFSVDEFMQLALNL